MIESTLLREFLVNGRLGQLRLGQSQADVVAELGGPPDRSRRLTPLILRYGDLELTLVGDRVVLIAVEAPHENRELQLPKPLSGKSFASLLNARGRDAVGAVLLAEGIDWTEFLPLTFDDQYCLVTGGKVKLVGVVSTGELETLQLSSDRWPTESP